MLEPLRVSDYNPKLQLGSLSDFTFHKCPSCSFHPFISHFPLIHFSFLFHLTYNNCPLLLLANHHYVCLISQQLLVCLRLEVPRDLSSAVLNQFWWCVDDQVCFNLHSATPRIHILALLFNSNWKHDLKHSVPFQ